MRVFVLVALMVALVRCHPNPQLDFQPRRGRTPNAKGDYSFRLNFNSHNIQKISFYLALLMGTREHGKPDQNQGSV